MIQSSRTLGARASSGIARTVSEFRVKAAAAAAVPNRNPRAKLRRSINSIDGSSLDRTGLLDPGTLLVEPGDFNRDHFSVRATGKIDSIVPNITG
jgi:hypothetical protein